MEKKKILIVEDEGIVAMEIKSELETIGYAADTAGSGEEAIKSIESSLPDLVVMDIRLPGKINGTETAAWIRENHNIPVIYLTAHMDEDTLEKAKATAPYSYILKPFNLRELHIAIDIALYRYTIEKEKEQLVNELRDALSKVKTLNNLLPICAYCKKIRDDKGYWEQVEAYISNHTDTLFTHAICPDCYVKAIKEVEVFSKKYSSGAEN